MDDKLKFEQKWFEITPLQCLQLVELSSVRKNHIEWDREMATVIGLPIRWSRLKIKYFRQFANNYSTKNPINRNLNNNNSKNYYYWCYLFGGGVLFSSYLQWQQPKKVYAAFNPKKVKVSVIQLRFIYKYFLGSSQTADSESC